MKSTWSRIVQGMAITLTLAICFDAVPWDTVISAPAGQAQDAGQPLVGTWQLVSVQVIGPNGPRNDPFYNANPSGILIYDSSGWMSVQIASAPRPSLQAHASRSAGRHSAEDAQLEATVFDTYYAYAGTWTYDSALSKVTHHVDMSLIPEEAGKIYSQKVHLDGDTLTFTVPRGDLGAATVQEKVWKRMGGRTD